MKRSMAMFIDQTTSESELRMPLSRIWLSRSDCSVSLRSEMSRRMPTQCVETCGGMSTGTTCSSAQVSVPSFRERRMSRRNGSPPSGAWSRWVRRMSAVSPL